jgi:thioesterase domain-containing protein
MSDIPPKAPTGYQIEKVMSAWEQARDRLLLADPSLADDEVALYEALGPVEADRQALLARLLRSAIHARDMAEQATKRLEDLKARQARYIRRAASVSASALAMMQETGERRFELPDLSASIRRNPESVKPTDEDLIPPGYWVITTTRAIDKNGIRRAIKAGEAVPGAELVEGAESLQIRTV